MELADELKAHKKWKGDFPQMEFPGKLWVKDLGSRLAKESLGLER
jgi:hypothetical protein